MVVASSHALKNAISSRSSVSSTGAIANAFGWSYRSGGVVLNQLTMSVNGTFAPCKPTGPFVSSWDYFCRASVVARPVDPDPLSPLGRAECGAAMGWIRLAPRFDERLTLFARAPTALLQSAI